MLHSIGLKPTALIIAGRTVYQQMLADMFAGQGFHVLFAESGQSGIEIWAEKMKAIRLVVVDLEMAEVDGSEVIKTIRIEENLATYIVALTSQATSSHSQDIIHGEVDAWIHKPIEIDQLEALLHTAKLRLRLHDVTDLLAGLTELAAERGGETAGHLQRTKRYCYILADDLRRRCPDLGLTMERVGDIAEISVLHDIGKIGLPDGLLTKRGRYTPKEYEIIKDHTTIGGTLLRKMYQQSGSIYILLGYEIAMTHHEKWDGSGYPLGLQGENIPLSGRIMAFADAYDALLSRRPYKDPLSLYHAEHAIKEGTGRHFDPQIVESYQRNRQKFVDIHRDFQEIDQF
ncbi:MAG: response regulator [Desulforhopalus sp.]|nr:response regulator [Desulforhopalus sp.]